MKEATPERQAQVRELATAIAQSTEQELLEIADALLDAEPESLFGQTESKIRDLALKIAAKAYEKRLAQKKQRPDKTSNRRHVNQQRPDKTRNAARGRFGGAAPRDKNSQKDGALRPIESHRRLLPPVDSAGIGLHIICLTSYRVVEKKTATTGPV